MHAAAKKMNSRLLRNLGKSSSADSVREGLRTETTREGLVAEFLDWIGTAANPPILTIVLINYSTHRNYFSLIYGSFERAYQVVLLYIFISKLASFVFEIRVNQI